MGPTLIHPSTAQPLTQKLCQFINMNADFICLEQNQNCVQVLETVPHFPRWLLSKVDCSDKAWMKANVTFLFFLFLEMHTLSRQEIAPWFNKLHGSVTQFAAWEHEEYHAPLSRGELLSCLCSMNVKPHPHLSPSLCVCVMELQLHSAYSVLGMFLNIFIS